MEKPSWIQAEELDRPPTKRDPLFLGRASELCFDPLDYNELHLNSIISSDEARALSQRRAPDPALLETAIKQEIQQEFETERRTITNQQEAQINEAIDQLETRISSNWEPQINSLQEKIRFCEELLESQRVDSEHKGQSEFEYWKREVGPSVLQQCKRTLQEKIQAALTARKLALETQVQTEIEEFINSVKEKYASEARRQKAQIVRDQMETDQVLMQELHQQACDELRVDPLFKHQFLAKLQLSSLETKEIMEELTNELKTNKLPELREEVEVQLEEEYVDSMNEIEQHYKRMIQRIEDDAKYTCRSEVTIQTDEKLKLLERELKISYLKKSENQLKMLQKKFETRKDSAVSQLKQLLRTEKAEVSRLKALFNVNMKQFNNKKREDSHIITQLEEQVEKKFRQLQYHTYHSDQYSLTKPKNTLKTLETTNKPLTSSTINFQIAPQESFQDIPITRKLLTVKPSSNLASTLLQKNEQKLANFTQKFQNPHKTQHKTQTVYNSQNFQDSQNALKFPSSQVQNSPIENPEKFQMYANKPHKPTEVHSYYDSNRSTQKHSLYEKLLQVHHGIIEPRSKHTRTSPRS